MARINIEDSIYKDVRFIRLVVAFKGDLDRAVGAMVRAWGLAQDWYLKTPDRLIPLSDWQKQSIAQEIIEVGLAEIKEDRVRVIGAEEQFKWLLACSTKGKKSGKARREKKGKSGEHKRTQANTPEAPSPSPSPSLSLSQETLSFQDKGEVASATPAAPIKNSIGYFIGVYRNAFKRRYGDKANPDVRGKVQGQIKTLLGDTPIDRACLLIQKYCEMNDKWFLTKGHDFGTFMENLTKVGLALDTGRAITWHEANAVDRKQTNMNVFTDLEKELESA